MSPEDYQMLMECIEDEAEELGKEEVAKIKALAKENARIVVIEFENLIKKYGEDSEYGNNAIYMMAFMEAYLQEFTSMMPEKANVMETFVRGMFLKEE